MCVPWQGSASTKLSFIRDEMRFESAVLKKEKCFMSEFGYEKNKSKRIIIVIIIVYISFICFVNY